MSWAQVSQQKPLNLELGYIKYGISSIIAAIITSANQMGCSVGLPIPFDGHMMPPLLGVRVRPGSS
ncbi:hypothetical protein N7491_004794 [Penicillium cf. griseofulvum]|uniref:Uncharacterized protein n=1 Tax=Penicillium cf. griseofulvum TaxID=2972120 RepID=A0A9W9M4H7_9EURO|nr:hypothetical protein N7472_007483 [Penicillium cf. griseofulvum]KAJ5434199.1 hypothetical protein N7491_004794 [Penicillium cf. griseofulvum]